MTAMGASRPRDFNQLAKRVVDIGTGQVAADAAAGSIEASQGRPEAPA